MALRNAQLNLLRDALDAGAGAGTLTLYGGSQPATPETATLAFALATLALSKPSAPDATAATLRFSQIEADASASADGHATWARLSDADGNAVLDCDVAESGATVVIDSETIYFGGPVRCTSFVLTLAG